MITLAWFADMAWLIYTGQGGQAILSVSIRPRPSAMQ